MKNEMGTLFFWATVALFSASGVQAQLTWDPALDGGVTGGTGVWDGAAANWWDGAANSTWINNSNAVFGGVGGGSVTIASGSSIFVNDLTLNSGVGKYSFLPETDNEGFSVNPGAVWTINTNELEFIGNQANDFKLMMPSVGTLTVIGSGTLDGGERQNDADWEVSGSTLDVQGTLTVRGHPQNVGQFSTVKMGDGTTYIHERAAGQTYTNDWELVAGEVTFTRRFNVNMTFDGEFSGAGKVVAKNLNGYLFTLNNTNNTHSGGIGVDGGDSSGDTRFSIGNPAVLGAVPATLDPDNIILRNGGLLLMRSQSIVLEATRGITIEGSGGVVNSTAPHTILGPITGDGQFLVGRNDGYANSVTLHSVSNDYTGGTYIRSGKIILGVDNAMPTNGVLKLGYENRPGRLEMNGFNQTITGLQTGGWSTKEILNNGGVPSTLTINNDSNYIYGSNFAGSNDIHIVKDGLGRMEFSRTGAFTHAPASITINSGVFSLNSTDPDLGLITVNNGGTLMGKGLINEVVFNSGSKLSPGYWVGSIQFSGDVDLSNITADNANGLSIAFNEGVIDQILAPNGTVTIGMTALGFSDFEFKDNYGLTNGTYTIIEAASISGSLDSSDLSGPVGGKGATGTLSISDNTVVLTVTAGDYSPFGLWAAGHKLYGEQAAGNADPDNDGYDNLQEFAHGGDPTNAAIIGYVPTIGTLEEDGTSWLTLAYGYRSSTNSGVSYECLTSDSLLYSDWTNAGITTLGSNTLNETFNMITNGIPMDGTVDFLGVFLEKQE
ncbi:MAG: hypothetical protein V5783_04615 [Pontiella sp.]